MFYTRTSKLSQKHLFLIDGMGALVSAFFLGFILIRFQSLVGMPVEVLYPLAALALIFAIYSLSCYLLAPTNLHPFLKFIAIVNSFYCLATLGLVIWHYQLLTFLGFCYFFLEIVIIALLVSLELRYINNN
ncbi:hypothetical protein [Ekhidna sp. To15]|uniref:hypothetical protein n=1 Tax=Ekhidna sp. To15 TaxID=3395267 RepID=UPI003F51F894